MRIHALFSIAKKPTNEKFKILQRILSTRLIGIIRADSQEDALKLAEACIEGGIIVLEISFTTPDTLEVIRTLARKFGDRILVELVRY